ncbi:siderophore ABC transporter substrate-binding protein [Comamonas composti]|uniref:siderophore ABC transporter substrate-binding protein n=1 Tax=Comamonas composti TaxID=408558 RepID=UPI00040C6E4F|nr:ABC transporter substrate-binding protein [Comamonas composti]
MHSLWTRRKALSGLGVVLSLTLASPQALAQATQSVKIKDNSGEVTVPLKPKTVLVYDLGALDIIQTLGGDVSGVPNQAVPEMLSKFKDASKYPHIGSLFEPDYEKIKALKPDLIIAGNRTLPKIAELKKFAPVLDVTLDNQNQMQHVYRNIRSIAAIYGVPEKGEQQISEIETAITDFKGKVAGKGDALFVMTNGGKLSVYGPGSRFDMVYSVFGVSPIKNEIEVSKHGQAVSFEYLLKTNPEWLLVLDRDAAIGKEGDAARKLLDNKLMHATKAWRKQQIVYLNAANWYILSNSSPTAIKENLKQLSDAFSK